MTRALVVFLLALAAPAAATGICDPENPALEEGHAEEEAAPAEVIVPCAMAEGGLFGAACADAPVYVVTPTGVVLCQVSLAIVAPAGPSSELTDRPAPAAPGGSTWSAPHALLSLAPRLPPRGEGPAARSPADLDGPPQDPPPDEVWGPS